MKKLFSIVIALTIALSTTDAYPTAPRGNEELHIVTLAPVAVNGGMIRYYYESPRRGRVFERYSYGGNDGSYFYIQRYTNCSADGSERNEVMNVPIRSDLSEARGVLHIGSRDLELRLHPTGRVMVRELTD